MNHVRRPQFSLKTLLWLMAVVAVAMFPMRLFLYRHDHWNGRCGIGGVIVMLFVLSVAFAIVGFGFGLLFAQPWRAAITTFCGYWISLPIIDAGVFDDNAKLIDSMEPW